MTTRLLTIDVFTGVAQLVEQRSPKPQAAGSNPAARALFTHRRCIMVETIRGFFTDVNKEMKKVSWPTREQLQESTVVVVITCLVIAGIVFVIDQGMTQVMSLIF